MVEVVRVPCNNCSYTVKAREKYQGKTVKCPKCAHPLAIPAAEEEAEFLDDDAFEDDDYEDYEDYEAAAEDFDDYREAPPVPARRKRRRRGLSDVDAGRVSRPRSQRRQSSGEGGLFTTNGGVIGGILMMVIAVVWFVVGWNNGVIFFYPPILFIIGLIAFFKGL